MEQTRIVENTRSALSGDCICSGQTSHHEVHSSTQKLVPSDVVWWFMSKEVQLGVVAGVLW